MPKQTKPSGKGAGLNRAQEKAALLAADDRQTDEQIAKECGIARVTLARWKRMPEFAARVAEHRRAWRDQIKAEGIADQKARIAALEDRWRRLRTVIEERAADPEMQAIPGGKTGLLRVCKVMSTGKEGQTVKEYELDAGLLREMREHEKQAAQELGQYDSVAPSVEDGSFTLQDLAMLFHVARKRRLEAEAVGMQRSEPRQRQR